MNEVISMMMYFVLNEAGLSKLHKKPILEEKNNLKESKGKQSLTLATSSFTPALIPGVMTPEEDTWSCNPSPVGSSKALSMKM